MPNHSSKPKRPRDINQLAKLVVELATGEPGPETPRAVKPAAHEDTPSAALRQAAAELGRRGGLKGGKARSEKLTAEQRSAIAKKAANERWGNAKEKKSDGSL